MNKIKSGNQKSSEEIFVEALSVLPGGVSRNTIFRKPNPVYVSHASGCNVTDIEGTERIDFANNMASLIHGHANPTINQAVINQIQKGTAYTLATEIEFDFAKMLTGRSKGFERIRFVNSGTEAVMAMIKASRAFTKKPKIAKAEGAYHGTYDFAEVSQTSNPSNWGDINKPNSVPVAQGTPANVLNDVLVFPYNDIEKTLAILDSEADQIACVLIDPAPHRVGLLRGTQDFVEALYNWTRKNNALLVFDEVVTFRTNYGGAQTDYKIVPDLTALGKIIGGGYPIGALTGRADIMDLLNPMNSPIVFPHSGTFSANPISTTAGKIAMELFDQEAVENLNKITAKAKSQVEEAVKIADVPISITGLGSMFRIHLTSKPPTTYREAYQTKEAAGLITELLDYMFIEEKIMMVNTCTCMFSTAIQQKEVDRLSEGFLNAFKSIKPKLLKL